MTWNDIIDHLMPELSPTDWKIASYLWDATDQGTISITRTHGNIAHQTGLSRATVIRSLWRLKTKGIISVAVPEGSGGTDPLIYEWRWQKEEYDTANPQIKSP